VEKRIVQPDGTVRWISAKGRVFFDAGAERRPVRTVGVVADVTERRHAQERQQFLLQELNHRIGNLLTTVRSVAASTVRSSAGLTDFERGFAGRLDALARTYTLLAAVEWRSTGLRSLVEEALAPYRAADTGNVTLSGDDLRLPANVALSLSLVLHELATNAAKYGALSVPTGRVEVDWRARQEPAGRRLVLQWVECGGPAVGAPSRRGFGRSLIERSIALELGGEARLEFAPAGVRCRIEAPLETER
jgi:two-component sensor histidine kinase